MNVSLCLCKRSGLLRDGAPKIIQHYYYMFSYFTDFALSSSAFRVEFVTIFFLYVTCIVSFIFTIFYYLCTTCIISFTLPSILPVYYYLHQQLCSVRCDLFCLCITCIISFLVFVIISFTCVLPVSSVLQCSLPSLLPVYYLHSHQLNLHPSNAHCTRLMSTQRAGNVMVTTSP